MKTRRGGIAAFTLAELMVVIVIIGVLAAFLLPAILKGRQTADIAQAKQRISALSLALDQFNNDFGFYPPTTFAFNPNYNPNLGDFRGTTGVTANYYGDYNYSEALVQCLCNRFTKGVGDDTTSDGTAVRGVEKVIGNAPVIAGPYLEVKESDLTDLDSDGFPELADPWGNPYIYVPKDDYLKVNPNPPPPPYVYNAGALLKNDNGTDADPTASPLNLPWMRFKFQLISLGPDGWTPGLDPTPHAVHLHRYWDITIAGNLTAGGFNPALVGTDDEPSKPVINESLGHTDETADDINNWK